MNKTILVIDDDQLMRDSLAHILETKGLSIIKAASGKEGLEILASHPVDLIVTDIRMPEMDGLEMVEELRKDPLLKNLPVIILSSDEQANTLNQALQAGVTVYLSKNSADAEALASQILTAVGQ